MSDSNTDPLTLSRLDDLKEAAQKHAIEILFTDLSDPETPAQSGCCKIRGKDWIVVDQRLTPARQVETLLNIFQQFNWDDIYVAAWIRERLDDPKLTGISS